MESCDNHMSANQQYFVSDHLNGKVFSNARRGFLDEIAICCKNDSSHLLSSGGSQGVSRCHDNQGTTYVCKYAYIIGYEKQFTKSE